LESGEAENYAEHKFDMHVEKQEEAHLRDHTEVLSAFFFWLGCEAEVVVAICWLIQCLGASRRKNKES
jgi:hypothetical protein